MTGEPFDDKEARFVEIYGLACPETGKVRYVGKASCAAKRLAQHLREARRRTPLYDWIKSLRDRGLSPRLLVLETCNQSDWMVVERRLISEHRKLGPMLNVADGGDEPHCSKETRAANGRRNARLVHDNPKSRHLWELKQKLGILIRKGYVSERTKEKLRQAAKDYPHILGEYAAL